MMKYLNILLWMPLILGADTLTEKEIDQLVDSAFNTDSGSQNNKLTKNLPRSPYPYLIFINVEGGDIEAKQSWMDEIYKVSAELQQLTDLNFTVMPEPKTWPEVRKYVMGKPVANMQIYFQKTGNIKLGGQFAKVDAGTTSANIQIDGLRSENMILHLIREEMTNAIALLGDTWKDSKSIFYQGQNYPQVTEYTETDRRIIHAYFHFDRNETVLWPKQYDEETFRQKISTYQIDEEAVYGGLFRNRTKFKANWLYFERYPWVYSSRGNSWYYFKPYGHSIYVWSQNSSSWAPMQEVFNFVE